MKKPRRPLVIGLLAAAGLLIFVANFLAWTQCTLLDSSEFQDEVSEALDEPAAQERAAAVIAESISNSDRIQTAIDERLPENLALLAPVLKSQLENGLQAVAERVLASEAFRGVRDEIVLRLHRTVVGVLKDERAIGVQGDQVVLDLNDLAPAVLQRIGLEAAERTQGGSDFVEGDGRIVLVEDAGLVKNISFIARNADVVALLAALAGLACLAGAIALSADVRGGIRASGYVLLGVGVTTLLIVFAVNQVVGGLYPERTVLRELVSSILSNLRLQALALTVVGAVAAIALDSRLIGAAGRARLRVGGFLERTGLPAPLLLAGAAVGLILII
jgi:hypothetical protein